MANHIISRQDNPNRNIEFTDLLKRWVAFFEVPTKLLVYHLYTKYDASETEISNVLKISRQRVNQKYPKGAKV